MYTIDTLTLLIVTSSGHLTVSSTTARHPVQNRRSRKLGSQVSEFYVPAEQAQGLKLEASKTPTTALQVPLITFKMFQCQIWNITARALNSSIYAEAPCLVPIPCLPSSTFVYVTRPNHALPTILRLSLKYQLKARSCAAHHCRLRLPPPPLSPDMCLHVHLNKCTSLQRPHNRHRPPPLDPSPRLRSNPPLQRLHRLHH